MGGLTALVAVDHGRRSSPRVTVAGTPATWARSWPSAPSPARCSAASSSTARWAGAGASTSACRSRSSRCSSCRPRCTSRPERARSEIDYLGALLISVAASLPLLWVTFAGQRLRLDVVADRRLPRRAPPSPLVLAVVVELKVPEPLVPLKVLRNRTAALVIVASAAVGIAMFGGTTFLGQYFQVARGYSPTHAGLLTIPLMAGLLVSSTGAGQIISRTGRWKKFLVGGGIFLVAGLVGLGTLDHTTPLWQVGIYMAVMGVGLGAMMQNLVLAVQNTVDVRDIGAASATVAFFRTLGGAVGVSVLGAVLATQVQDSTLEGLRHLGAKAAAAAARSQSAAGLDLAALPAPIRTIVRQSYGDATGRIFVISAVVRRGRAALRGLHQGGAAAHDGQDRRLGGERHRRRRGHRLTGRALPEVTATAGTSDTPRASHTPGPPVPPGPSRPTGVAHRCGVGVHRARVANPERIQASSPSWTTRSSARRSARWTSSPRRRTPPAGTSRPPGRPAPR